HLVGDRGGRRGLGGAGGKSEKQREGEEGGPHAGQLSRGKTQGSVHVARRRIRRGESHRRRGPAAATLQRQGMAPSPTDTIFSPKGMALSLKRAAFSPMHAG